ncbi:MAG: AAA family ATPase [Bacteroidaceae bacterium]|nr:AAA family ATPase [Bacteroidaceae bacterium]
MKFQKLTIHNIASIEDAVIDFESAPLADSEVFLITGKTGAGKSTILDAICLALYADTPRLKNTNMQGATKDADKEVKIDDPRQLLRRNTIEGFVSLTFMGSNGVNYKASWEVARAYKKLSGAVKSKTWELQNLNNGNVLTKDQEIKNEIQAAVGLDFNQFCRTTMLAQGEFTRFLNSKDDDKAEILEKITGVDVYSKIGTKIYEVTGQKKQEWDDANRQVEGIRIFTDEEIAEKQDAISQLDNKGKELKKLSDTAISKRQWLTEEHEMIKSITNATEEHEGAKLAAESEDFKQNECTIRDWNASIEARTNISEIDKAAAVKDEQNRCLNVLKGEYETLISGQKYEEQELDNLSSKIKDIDDYLTNEKDNAEIYENVQTLVGHLNTMYDGGVNIEKGKKVIDDEDKILNDKLYPELEKTSGKLKEANDVFNKQEAKVKKCEEEVAKLNLSELRKQRDNSIDLLNKIETARERIDTLTREKERMDTLKRNLVNRLAGIEDKQKEANALEEPIQKAKVKMDTQKEILDKQSDTVNKFAQTLRMKLHIGDTCPICGQEIKQELPHEEVLSNLVTELKNAYEASEKEYKDLTEKLVKLNAEIKSETTSYNRDKQTFDQDESIATANKKVVEACKLCGVDKVDESILTELAEQEKKARDSKEKLDVIIKQGENKEEDLKAQRKELENARREVDSLTKAYQQDEKDVNASKGRIDTQKALVESKIKQVEMAEQMAAGIITKDKWTKDWRRSPKEFAVCITEAAKKYNEGVKNKQELTGKVETAKTLCKNVTGIIDAICAIMPTWKEIMTGNVYKVEKLLDKANNVNTSVTMVLTKLTSAEEILASNMAAVKAFMEENPSFDMERLRVLNRLSSQNVQDMNEELEKIRKNVVEKQTLLASFVKQHDEHIAKKPDIEDGETIETINIQLQDLERQTAEIGENKGAINQELKTDAENRQKVGTLKQEAEKKYNIYQKWARLNSLIGNATGTKFRKIAQSYVLSNLIHSANHYMKSLTDRYTLKVDTGTFVISIEDAYQGYVSRAASTISGGESFLVSLSLALGLSDIGQQWQVDTLFIDEGFGTLSGEPLQKAIETLRSLHSHSGRHVGIISHVEELQERIPVQIQVNQEGNNSSSKIRIVPEK